MAPRRTKRASEERQALSDEDLRKLFHGDDYLKGNHREPYMYWAPLIALYTGARLNEIAQPHLVDFVAIDGGYAITVNDQGDSKRVKTSASERSIPIHPELVRLGLLRFVEALQAKKVARLFPSCRLGGAATGRPYRSGSGAIAFAVEFLRMERCFTASGTQL